jgi:hypothetical protein
MGNKLSKQIGILSAILLASSCVMSATPAQAGIFDLFNQINSTVNDANRTLNNVRGTTENTTSTFNNLTNLLGVGKSNTTEDPSVQVLSIYGDWYKSMSPADKEIANALTAEYAEKGALSFASFKSSDLYKAKNPQDQQKASATFFKFSEVVKNVGAQKDKFLAFAFCVNGGSTTCK